MTKEKDETEVKNYRFIIRLKSPKEYVTKDGVTKQIESYFATDCRKSEILDNAIALTIENAGGTFKINLDKSEIAEIKEIV